MVELQDGKIDIDGLDISTLPLEALRTRIAFVPQDSTLFLGTLRDNLYVGVTSGCYFMTQTFDFFTGILNLFGQMPN